MFEKHANPYKLTNLDNLNAPHTPGDDTAGCDPDFDASDDDDLREIKDGLRDMARMNGERV
ncbi:MAG: hypothetical protein QM647_15225 [Asticcacaulis sp.]|uniref:hypothetical protein n=1 Tax=Asticcacaulis sp. TaxID=1872648 RepID=UPI0039E53303